MTGFEMWVRGRLYRIEGYIHKDNRRVGKPYTFFCENMIDLETFFPFADHATLTVSEIYSIDKAYWDYEEGKYLEYTRLVWSNADGQGGRRHWLSGIMPVPGVTA